MDNSPLNKAHQQQRKADAYLKHGNFDKCIKCHKQSISLLQEACSMTENPISLDSLNLQMKYHEEQVDYLMRELTRRTMRDPLDQLVKDVMTKQRKLDEQNASKSFYRTIELYDSLIDYLGKRGGNGGSDNESLTSYSTSDTDEKPDKQTTTQVMGNKHPKDDAQVIEELKVLSGQLRDSVQCLLTQLSERNDEIDRLKARIKVFENDKQGGSTKNNSYNLQVVENWSENTSPDVSSPLASPCTEVSPDILNDTRILPPLELPNFDYLSLVKSKAVNEGDKDN